MTALNVLTGILSARLLGAEGRGVFAAVSFWPQLLGAIAIGGAPIAIVYLGRRHPAGQPALTRAALALGAAATVVATLVGLYVVPRFLASHGPEVATLGALCALFTFVNVGHMICRQLLVSRQDFARFNIACWMPSFTFLVALLALHATGSLDAWSASIAVVASGLPVLFWLVRVVWTGAEAQAADAADAAGAPAQTDRDTDRGTDDGGADRYRVLASLKSLLHFGLRGTPGEIVMVLSQHVDRLILVALVSPVELGLYVVALSFSRLLLILQVSTSTVLLPSMANRRREDIRPLHDRAFWITLGAAALVAFVAIGVGGPALRLTYGPEFEGALPIFQVLVIEAALACVAQVTSHLFQALDRPGMPSTIQVLSFALALVGCAILIPRMGAYGAALAMLGATAGRLLMLLLAARFTLDPVPPMRPWQRRRALTARTGRAE